MKLLPAILFALQISYAQSLPDGNQLNKQAIEAAKRFQTLQFVTESTMEMLRDGAEPIKNVTEATNIMANPGRMRVESTTQGTSVLVISNADGIYMSIPSIHQYTRIPAALGPVGLMESFGIKLPDMSAMPPSAHTLRDEIIEVAGRKFDCWVVENKLGELSMPMPGNDKMQIKMKDFTTTSWVDKKLLIDVQSDSTMKMEMAGMPAMSMHIRTVKKDLKIDEPVAESLFTFTPPADSKEVKDFGFAASILPKADLEGKDAPAFEVKGIDGKTYSQASLQGKTVMLDFWATWCVPCRQSAPAMEKIFAEYKDRGLVVLGVNVGEERETIDAYVKKSPFLYPVVLGEGSGILDLYKVTAYPTFVLIQDGKVVAHTIGFIDEGRLRGMVEKANFPSAK